MALTKSTITGRVPLPTDAAAISAVVRFTISGVDTEGADVVLPAYVDATLDGDDMPANFSLWRNTEGLRGTYYTVTASWQEALVTGQPALGLARRSATLGTIQIGASASYTLADLLNNPVPAAPSWNVNLQAISETDNTATLSLPDGTPIELLKDVPTTRAGMVTAIAGGFVPENGRTYWLDGLAYVGSMGATAISDLPGFVPAGDVTPNHFGAVSGAADVRAAFVAARDYFANGTAGKIVVPPGVWNISTSFDANNGRFINWEIADGAQVLPSVAQRISGATWRIYYPRTAATDVKQIRGLPSSGINGDTLVEYQLATNTGGENETGYAWRKGYVSSAFGVGRYDIADAVLATFNRDAGEGGGQMLTQWLVNFTPSTGDGTAANRWGAFVAEWNIINRGPDTGFAAERSTLQNWTGIHQIVIEDDLAGASPLGGNVTFGTMYAGQTPTGLDVDRRRFYTAILGESDCIAGQTGRAIYWSGDTTGQANRTPHAIVEGAQRWEYGFLTVDVTATTGVAYGAAIGQKFAWLQANLTETSSISGQSNGAIRETQGTVARRDRINLRRAVSNPSGVRLTTDNNAATAANTLLIGAGQMMAFYGIATAVGAGPRKSWRVEGTLYRPTNEASTVLHFSAITVLAGDAGASSWTLAASADTTLGGLNLNTTGTGGYTVACDLSVSIVDAV